MIALTPWILVLAATSQDPEPVTQAPITPPPVTQAPTPQTPVPQSPVTQAPVSQPPAVPPAEGGTGDTKPAAQGADDTKKSDEGKSSADKPNPEGTDEPSRDAQGWSRIDGVQLIINQDITTKRDLQHMYFIKYRDTLVKDRDEEIRRSNEILNERVDRILAMQAGEDLGVSEELVKLQVNDWFDNIVKNRGVVELTKLLEARHQTPEDLRKDHREQLYVKLWEGLVTGEGAGAGKRPIRDRFIRPGELKFHYNDVIQDRASYGALGGRAETLTLQRLLLDPKENGGVDKTIEFAQSLRERILDGDDMSELVAKYGKEKEGMIRDIPLADLKRQFPSMGRFAERAQVDEVSEPLKLTTGDGTYVQILRLVDKKPGVKPELTSQQVQNVLTTNLQKKLDGYRKEVAYADLIEASYIWPDQRRKKN